MYFKFHTCVHIFLNCSLIPLLTPSQALAQAQASAQAQGSGTAKAFAQAIAQAQGVSDCLPASVSACCFLHLRSIAAVLMYNLRLLTWIRLC